MATKKKVIRSTAKLTTLDDFLGEEGKRDEFEAVAVKEVLAWQIRQAMKEKNISRNSLAQRMKTSRSQIGRLLDPKDGNVTLATLQRRAHGWAVAPARTSLRERRRASLGCANYQSVVEETARCHRSSWPRDRSKHPCQRPPCYFAWGCFQYFS